MPNDDYWKTRFELLKSDALLITNGYLKEVEEDYAKAKIDLEKSIAYWYRRFADNNGISYAEAQQMLKSDELKELRWSLKEYIKHGKENADDGQWMKELENALADKNENRNVDTDKSQKYEEVVFGQTEKHKRGAVELP